MFSEYLTQVSVSVRPVLEVIASVRAYHPRSGVKAAETVLGKIKLKKAAADLTAFNHYLTDFNPEFQKYLGSSGCNIAAVQEKVLAPLLHIFLYLKETQSDYVSYIERVYPNFIKTLAIIISADFNREYMRNLPGVLQQPVSDEAKAIVFASNEETRNVASASCEDFFHELELDELLSCAKVAADNVDDYVGPEYSDAIAGLSNAELNAQIMQATDELQISNNILSRDRFGSHKLKGEQHEFVRARVLLSKENKLAQVRLLKTAKNATIPNPEEVTSQHKISTKKDDKRITFFSTSDHLNVQVPVRPTSLLVSKSETPVAASYSGDDSVVLYKIGLMKLFDDARQKFNDRHLLFQDFDAECGKFIAMDPASVIMVGRLPSYKSYDGSTSDCSGMLDGFIYGGQTCEQMSAFKKVLSSQNIPANLQSKESSQSLVAQQSRPALRTTFFSPAERGPASIARSSMGTKLTFDVQAFNRLLQGDKREKGDAIGLIVEFLVALSTTGHDEFIGSYDAKKPPASSSFNVKYNDRPIYEVILKRFTEFANGKDSVANSYIMLALGDFLIDGSENKQSGVLATLLKIIKSSDIIDLLESKTTALYLTETYRGPTMSGRG